MSILPIPSTVVKVGGSLLDHQALGAGLRQWLDEQVQLPHLFVPGGGKLADVIRTYHRIHGAGEEDCHWMAIQTMAINARLLKSLIPNCAEVDHPSNHPMGQPGVLNAFHFCLHDQFVQGALPHDWRVTSDSIAARTAEVKPHSRLILLKSLDLPEGIDWAQAAEGGLVDPMFPEMVQRAKLPVEWINFRKYLDAFCQFPK